MDIKMVPKEIGRGNGRWVKYPPDRLQWRHLTLAMMNFRTELS